MSTPLARRYGCFAGLGWLLLLLLALAVAPRTAQAMAFEQVGEDLFAAGPSPAPAVSYTPLTLPTNREV